MTSVFRDVNEEARAQMAFFLVLNSKLGVTEELKDDMNVGLFVGASPTLTKEFLIEMLFELHLDDYLCEVIYSCPGVMVVELLDVLVNRLKDPNFHKKNHNKFFLHNINQGIFASMIDEKKTGNSALLVLDHFKELLTLAGTVIATPMKLTDVSDEIVLYTGEQFYSYFKSLLSCLKSYKNPGSSWKTSEIYEITINLTEELIENPEDIKEKSLYILLTQTETILKSLTLDMWMSWSDYSTDENKKSIQQSIGEIIYEIIETIQESDIKISEDMKNCLSNLKIKPETEDDIITKADIDEIILNVENENNKSRDKWAKALAKFRNVLLNEEAVTCLVKNLELIHLEDLRLLIDECLKNLDEKSLLLNIFKRLPVEDQYFYLEKILTEHDYNVLACDPTGLTEIFNKIVNRDEDLESELVCYALQAPLKTVTKICELAVHNPKELDFASALLAKLKTVCLLENFSEKNLISFVLKTLIDETSKSKEKQNLIDLITKLFELNVIDFKFVEKIILETIRLEILNGNFGKVILSLEIVKSSLKLKALEYNRIVLLAFMSQVLGHLSWDWTAFTIEKVEGRGLTVSIISFLLKGLEDANEGKMENERGGVCIFL